MNTVAILKKLEAYDTACALRARAELMHLDSISSVRAECYEQRLQEAGMDLLRKAEQAGAVTPQALEEFEASLMDLSAVAKEYTLHMVGHAHIDMNWQWGYSETVATTLETFRTVLKLMEEYPEFTFSQSQASVYQMVAKYEPTMLEQIRQRIREGRWEVTAATWVEGDKNMASGEAQCRQLLCTKEYLSGLLGIDPAQLRLDYEPDTFGHGVHVPEILANGGVDWMYHCRGCQKRYAYRWRAPSGKEILVYQEPKWYIAMLNPIFLSDYPRVCARIGDGSLKDSMVVYGVGDHGGGPTRRDLERICEMQSWPLFPNVKFSRYDTFYELLEQIKPTLPVYEGELNFVFDGCYTTQTRIKMANSLSESRLYDAEAADALASACGSPVSCGGLLREGWQNTLFNQFHDILPGSNVIDSREWAMGKFQETMAAANSAANTALRAVTEQIDTTGIPFDNALDTTAEGAGAGDSMSNPSLYPFHFTERGRGSVRAWHVFNTTQYDREEYAELTVWDYTEDIRNVYVTDARGKRLDYKVLAVDESGSCIIMHRRSRLLVRISVPAFGYTTVILRPCYELERTEKLKCQLGDGPRVQAHLGDRNYVLENDRLRCEFDSVSCVLISMLDKRSGCELVKAGQAGFFEYVEENPRFGMTAWVVGPTMRRSNLNADQQVRVTEYTCDPVRSVLGYRIQFGNNWMTARIILDAQKPYLDYDIRVEWMEKGSAECVPGLRFVAEPGYRVKHYRYTTGNGTVIRQAMSNDVPSLGTMEYLPEEEQAAYLLMFSELKYGFRGNVGNSGVQLIRSSTSPDPYPELGRHYTHVCIGSAVSEADMYQTTFCAAHKLLPVSGFAHSGTRGMEARLLDYTGSCRVTAVYANAHKQLVVRLFNYTQEAQTVRFRADGPVYEANTLEQIMRKLDGVNGTVEAVVPGSAYMTLIFA